MLAMSAEDTLSWEHAFSRALTSPSYVSRGPEMAGRTFWATAMSTGSNLVPTFLVSMSSLAADMKPLIMFLLRWETGLPLSAHAWSTSE